MPLSDRRRGYRGGAWFGANPWENRPSDVFLYVVRCGDFVKVGLAADVRRRLRDFEAMTPYEVVLVGKTVVRADKAGMAERVAHEALADTHHRGEWFSASPETALKAIRAAGQWALKIAGPWHEACWEFDEKLVRICEAEDDAKDC